MDVIIGLREYLHGQIDAATVLKSQLYRLVGHGMLILGNVGNDPRRKE